MRLGVLSDVHGNHHGFEACIAAMGRVDRLVFVGDLLGYYFDGPAILRSLRSLDAICIAGNHDLYFLAHQGRAIPHAIPVPPPATYRAKYGPSLERAAAELTAEEVDWLAALPCERSLDVAGKRVLVVHGSPWRPADEYVYPDEPNLDRFAEIDASVVVMGHTHRPMHRELRGGALQLLNVGSCGQPRDGDPRASYGIIDVVRGAVSCAIHRVSYAREPLLERCRQLAPDVSLLRTLLLRDCGVASAP